MMRKIRRFLMVSIMFLLGTGVQAWANEAVFIPGTNINGYHVGGQTVDGAISYISEQVSSAFTFVIHEKDGQQEYISGGDIGLYKVLNRDEVQAVMDGQQANGGSFGMNAKWQNTVSETAGYDEAKLEERINGLNCFTQQTKTENARISPYQEGTDFYIIPEVNGNSLNVEAAKAAIREAVKAAQPSVDLWALGLYDAVTIDRNNGELNALCAAMNRISDISVTYQIREGTEEVLPGSMMASWVTGSDANGQIAVDAAKVTAYLNELAAKYDTSGKPRSFIGGAGAAVSVNTVYGWKIDVAAEVAALTEAIRTGQSQKREPVWARRGASWTMPEWGNTFVEVDMARQHVYYFQNGQVVWDAPCVTGNLSKGYDTPDGVYSIYSKERNRVLRGKKLPNGKYEYESPVDYWMPFNGGVGLHDANWRGSFGGSIYKTSGSHGCVNLPPKAVPALYDLVSVGTIVVCHNG